MGEWRYTPHIYDLSPRLSATLHAQIPLPMGNKPSYPLVVRQGETQIRFGRNGEKYSLSLSVGKEKADLQQYYAY